MKITVYYDTFFFFPRHLTLSSTDFYDPRGSNINPFLANVPILFPLKTPENLWFSGVFRG